MIPEAVRLRFLSERVLRLLSCPQSLDPAMRTAVAAEGLAFLERAAGGEVEPDARSFRAAEPDNLAAAGAVIDAFLLAPEDAPQDVESFLTVLHENETVLRAIDAHEDVDQDLMARARVFFKVLQDYATTATTAPFDTPPLVAIGR